jgi:hypothetical protein
MPWIIKIGWLCMDGGMEKGGGGGIELPRELAGVVAHAMRQGLVVINDSREAEAVVQFFTAMIVNKDPREITDWRSEYMAVGEGEFREELKLLAMPLVIEPPIMRAVEIPTGREFPAVLRKIFIISLALPVGLIILSQPSVALLINDGDSAYFGYRGFDPGTGDKVTVTIKSGVTDHVTVPFIPAIARFIFVGNIVEVVIDDSDHARDLRS